MGLGDFFKNLVGGSKSQNNNGVVYRTVRVGDDSYTPVDVNGEIMRTAMQIGVDYIASAVGKCEIRTFINNKEVRGDDWYLWNVRPNKNQTSTQFWSEVVHKLYFNKEVLILPINKQLIIADSFSKEVRAIAPTIFTGISRDSFAFNGSYTTENAIYLNIENNANTTSLSTSLGSVLDEMLKITCKHYYNEGGEHGAFYYDTSQIGTKEDEDNLNRILNEDFDAYFNSKNAVLPLYDGMRYEQMVAKGSSQKTSYVNDMSTIIREAYTRMAQALRVPPALLLGEVTDVNGVTKSLLTFAVDPLLDYICEAANAVMYGRGILEGNFLQADSSCIEHIDIFSSGGNIDKIHSNSILSVNEIRRKVGEPRIEEAWADSYIQTKNYETIEKKGGNSDV